MIKDGATPIDEKMSDSCLRLFGYVQIRAINTVVRKSGLVQVNGLKKGRGRPKITLVEVIEKNTRIKEVT